MLSVEHVFPLYHNQIIGVSRDKMLGFSPTVPVYSSHPQLLRAKTQIFGHFVQYICMPTLEFLAFGKHWSKSLEWKFESLKV